MSYLQERPQPPTAFAIAVAAALIAGTIGYFIGTASSVFSITSSSSATLKSKNRPPSSPGESSSEDEAGELQDFKDSTEECKLVLVVRTDLGMTKGKIAAQCSHATLACYKHFLAVSPVSPILRRWERQGQMKVALQIKSEDELDMLQAQAMSLGLCAKVIHDAGRTQIASGSATVLGIGPAPKSAIDQVTGGLKLL